GDPDRRPLQEETFWTTFSIDGGPPASLSREFGPPESNAFGTYEFLGWCKQMGAEPFLTANAGTGDPEEAADWVRYCNRPESPLPVHWWAIGNETYGDWEP